MRQRRVADVFVSSRQTRRAAPSIVRSFHSLTDAITLAAAEFFNETKIMKKKTYLVELEWREVSDKDAKRSGQKITLMDPEGVTPEGVMIETPDCNLVIDAKFIRYYNDLIPQVVRKSTIQPLQPKTARELRSVTEEFIIQIVSKNIADHGEIHTAILGLYV